jgi:histidinol-phosphate aminotransferase
MSADVAASDLGPLAARVPEVLRGAAAYHVPAPIGIRAKLDANELAYPLPAELRGRLGAVLAEIALERYPDAGARALRAVLAGQLGVPAGQLVFGNGSDELIAMLIAAFAAPRGERPAAVLYPTPSFVYYRLAAIARGIEAIEVPLDPRFELDEAAVRAAIEAHRPSVVFLALPNNPTGTLWRPAFALELAAAYRDVVVVADEAYHAYAGVTALPVLGDHPNLVVMRTLSKIGLAGLRVGFAIAAPAIVDVLEKVRPPYNVSSLDQAAAVFMVTEAAAWCAARVADVVAAREPLAAALRGLGLEVFPSAANLLMVRAGEGKAAALAAGLAARGIMVRSFDRPGERVGALAGCLRVTIGTGVENAMLVEAVGELLG